MDIRNSQYLSSMKLQESLLGNAVRSAENINRSISITSKGLSFQDILDQKAADLQGSSRLKFSKHALGRLSQRNISLTDEQMSRLDDGTQKASRKGIRDSLVIVDQLAFIVNVPNRTVVTAMENGETDENIFTNIDGAVII